MSLGDELRAQVLETIGNLEEIQALLQRAATRSDDVVGEILVINASGGSNSHHVRSAGRLSPEIKSEIEMVKERVLQVQSEMLQYYREIGGYR